MTPCTQISPGMGRRGGGGIHRRCLAVCLYSVLDGAIPPNARSKRDPMQDTIESASKGRRWPLAIESRPGWRGGEEGEHTAAASPSAYTLFRATRSPNARSERNPMQASFNNA